MYIETLTAEQRLAEPDDVAVYVRAFDLLRAAAVTGQDAVALIQPRSSAERGPGGPAARSKEAETPCRRPPDR